MAERKYVITGREPSALWRFFEDLSAIPRVTGNEAVCAAYVRGAAREQGLWYHEDELHNVLVRVPGSRGCEELPPVLIEGHMDIVGEKEPWSRHDFGKDPLELRVEGNILRANGTTLGADNGCACAVMLMLMTDRSLMHPPIECLFTAQEETGCFGAKTFDISLITARRCIGLDAGSFGVFRKGTTTKLEMTACFLTEREPVCGTVYRLYADGLLGGSQGQGVPMERICAIKQLARVLHHLNKELDVRLISIDKPGIQKSIPENCETYVCLAEGSGERLREIVLEQEALIRKENEENDPGFRMTVEAVTESDCGTKALLETMLEKEASDRLIEVLYLMPWGSFHRSLDRLDESMCSVIMKWVHTDEEAVRVHTCVSTERMDQGEALSEYMESFVKNFGFFIEAFEVERGWDADEASPIRDTMAAAFRELFGFSPKINISPGGNDCVYLKRRLPELDVVTTAADYFDYHTPKEYLVMDTFEKEYSLIVRTLELLAEGEN